MAALCSADPDCDGFEHVTGDPSSGIPSTSKLRYGVYFPEVWGTFNALDTCSGLFVRHLPSECRVW